MRKSKPVSAALLALALTLSFSTAALAEDTEHGTCGENLTWTYADGVLTISGEGEMDYAPELPDSATSVVIEDGVSSIGAFAFSGCSGLTEVFIPESVTSIGGGAFYECSALERISLPERVVSIGAVAFYRCSSLKHISLPDSVTSIGNWIFEGCTSLTDAEIGSGLTEISYTAFLDCASLAGVSIPESVTFISGYAFHRCTALTDVYYGGSEDAWRTVEISEYGNELLTSADLHPDSTVNEPTNQTGFDDVAASDYYFAPVLWAVGSEVTVGTSDTTFSPSDTCTRGQIITFLWRAAGSPAPTGSGGFSDVAADEYYADAAQWALEQGIDLSSGAFRPADPCTRATVVEYLYRLAGSPKLSVSSHSFADIPAGADYSEAVTWAVLNGVTEGTGTDTFGPDDACTRGQIVTFLYRALA